MTEPNRNDPTFIKNFIGPAKEEILYRRNVRSLHIVAALLAEYAAFALVLESYILFGSWQGSALVGFLVVSGAAAKTIAQDVLEKDFNIPPQTEMAAKIAEQRYNGWQAIQHANLMRKQIGLAPLPG